MQNMQGASQDRGKILADSIHNWWRDAGVDYLCQDQPANWLTVLDAPRLMPSIPAGEILHSPSPKPFVASSPVWPDEFASLQKAIATDPSMPGSGYGPTRAVPVGIAQADLMILTDFPEPEDFLAGELGHGAAGQLLQAMLSACGYSVGEVHLAALAYSRPASGALPKQEANLLANFARHQIKTVQPKRLLLLGTAVSEIILGKELMEARSNLPDFNQEGRNLGAVATFHPRTLLARPILKAQAWKDLQRIVKRDIV
jgi:uracil-DNA glycosylase